MAARSAPDPRLAALSKICRALPEAKASSRTGQHTAFDVRGRKFAYFLNSHHGDGRVTFTCRMPHGENARLIAANPTRYFMPPYSGRQGWVGVHLDRGKIDWGEVERLAVDSYLLVAPMRLVEMLGSGS